jgi:hypothetical protein
VRQAKKNVRVVDRAPSDSLESMFRHLHPDVLFLC